MKWSANSTSNFKMPDPGSYGATCYRVIDLGTQESTYQGEKKYARKVMIGFELDEDMEAGKPFVCSSTFTVSLHEKSSLRKFLSGWRGRDFTPEELGGFDPSKLIGAPCMLSLVQKGEYVNVDTASKLPKGMTPHKLVNPTIFFSIDEFNQAEFEKLSEKLQEKIANSPEYQALRSNDSNNGAFDDMPDDLPYDTEVAF